MQQVASSITFRCFKGSDYFNRLPAAVDTHRQISTTPTLKQNTECCLKGILASHAERKLKAF